MIKEFSVELTAEDGEALRALGGGGRVYPDLNPGRKTFGFDQKALTAISGGDFDRFLWTAFDRVEEREGILTLAKGGDLTFHLPVAKLRDPEIRRAIYDFVTGRVGLDG